MPKSLAESPATARAFPSFIRNHQKLTCPAIDEDSDDQEYDPNASASVAAESKAASQENLEELIREIGKEANIDQASIHFSRNFRKLTASTKRQRVQVAKRIVSKVCNTFAQDDPNQFEQMLCDKQDVDQAEAKNQRKLDGVMKRTVESFQNAPSSTTKQQALSLVAPFFKLTEIQAYLPGLSPYYYKRARLFAKMYKPGVPIPKLVARRQKLTKHQIEQVVQFITSPAIVVDLPFGTSTLTTSAGEKEEIPSVLRNQVNERINQQYQAYMIETQQQHLAVSRSTVLRILNYCTATTRKSLQGLDFYSWAGSEGFDTLINIAKTLSKLNNDEDWGNHIIRRLKESKQYLKMDYRSHLKLNSRIADHCIIFALSDHKDGSFRERSEHEHDLHCDRCEMLNNVLGDIRLQIDNTDFTSDLERSEISFDYTNAANDIMELKKHIVRTMRQDLARKEILAELNTNDIYIQMDWAMKFLPVSGREPQADWFGKRGVSWHVTHVTAKSAQAATGFRTRLYVHAFASVAQDGYTVLAILRHILGYIKQEMPQVNRAYLRSDNAGCYKSAVLISGIHKLSTESRIFIKRLDFSEAQAGKGPCDRASAWVKRNVRLYAAENHHCRTAEEFVACANSYQGVKSATIILGHLEVENRPKPKIAGINQLNNFEFQENGNIIAWRSYKIGAGKKLSKTWSDADVYIPEITVLSKTTEGAMDAFAITNAHYWKELAEPKVTPQASTDCWNEDEDDGDSDADQAMPVDELLFACPEPGCTKVYQRQSYLDNHLEIGNHHYKPERVTLRDNAIGAYKTELEGLRLPQSLPSVGGVLQELLAADDVTSPELKMGWALKSKRKSGHFDARVRAYLIEKFDEGKATKRKLDPKTIAKEMRQIFRQDVWLKWSQIASFWSRRARLDRQEPLADLATDDDDDADQQNMQNEEDLQDDPYFNTVEDDVLEAIKENAGNIYVE